MFRPTFETLENREVFSAAPLVLLAEPQSFSLNFTKIEFKSDSSPVAGNALVGDFNGDGRDHLAEIASRGRFFHMLPYMEQDNLYKSSAFSNIVLDDHAAGSQRTRDLRGEAIDIIPALQQSNEIDGDDAAHDALFADLSSTLGDSQWAEPRQQQIIAILIGLVADRSASLMHGDFSSARSLTDISDGTSNTLMFASRSTVGALDLNDLF